MHIAKSSEEKSSSAQQSFFKLMSELFALKAKTIELEERMFAAERRINSYEKAINEKAVFDRDKTGKRQSVNKGIRPVEHDLNPEPPETNGNGENDNSEIDRNGE